MASISEIIGLTSGVVTLVMAIAPAREYWRNWRARRAERSRITILREIDFLERMSQSPSARSELAQQRTIMICVGFGLWIMFQGMAFDEQGRKLVLVLDVLCGAGVYLLAAATLGDFGRIKNAPRKIAELRAKASKFQ